MRLPEQTQALPLTRPKSPQLSSQNSPRWLPVQTHSPNSPSHAASFSHAPQPLFLAPPRGPDERRVPENLTWNQFDATFKLTCGNGKVIEKHRFEVDHLWPRHWSIAEAMAIVHYKDHRKTGRPGRDLW